MPFRSHVKANLLINSKAFVLGNTRNLKLDCTDTADLSHWQQRNESVPSMLPTNQPTNSW